MSERRVPVRRKRKRSPVVINDLAGLNLDNILPVTVSLQARSLLERLARLGVYGRDASEVAARFIDEALQDFVGYDDL